jgi:hypothetical protein
MAKGAAMAERGRLRILTLLGGVVALVVIAFLVARPLVDQAAATSRCTQSNGTWMSDAGQCDYGTGGVVVRLLEQSAHCDDVRESNLRECKYSAERLQISIVGVGTSRAAVAIDGSDEHLGYGVSVFMGEGCIRVAPGAEMKEREPMRRTEDGVISTWTGNVYESMMGCWTAGLEVRGSAETTERAR